MKRRRAGRGGARRVFHVRFSRLTSGNRHGNPQDRLLTTHTGSRRPKPLLDSSSAAAGQGPRPRLVRVSTANASRGCRPACRAGIDSSSTGDERAVLHHLYPHRVVRTSSMTLEPPKGRDHHDRRDLLAHPDFATLGGFQRLAVSRCVARLNTMTAARSIAISTAQTARRSRSGGCFMTAPSPGILRLHHQLATRPGGYVARWREMKTSIASIVEALFVLHIDCPDLGSCRNNHYRDLSDDNSQPDRERTSGIERRRLPATGCGCNCCQLEGPSHLLRTCRC